MSEPRAITAEEARDALLRHIANIAKYWADLPDRTPLERCNGLAFSILNIFDGTTEVLPAIDLVLCPHDGDEAFNKSEGENWYEPGQVINDAMLHEMWHRYERDEVPGV
jgi:hypothetical protein